MVTDREFRRMFKVSAELVATARTIKQFCEATEVMGLSDLNDLDGVYVGKMMYYMRVRGVNFAGGEGRGMNKEEFLRMFQATNLNVVQADCMDDLLQDNTAQDLEDVDIIVIEDQVYRKIGD